MVLSRRSEIAKARSSKLRRSRAGWTAEPEPGRFQGWMDSGTRARYVTGLGGQRNQSQVGSRAGWTAEPGPGRFQGWVCSGTRAM